MDITVLNSSLQSALQLLLISLRSIHFGTTVNIASIEYDAEYMYDLVDRMASRYVNLRDFVAVDKYGFDVLDYTIRYSTHSICPIDSYSLTRSYQHPQRAVYMLDHV